MNNLIRAVITLAVIALAACGSFSVWSPMLLTQGAPYMDPLVVCPGGAEPLSFAEIQSFISTKYSSAAWVSSACQIIVACIALTLLWGSKRNV